MLQKTLDFLKYRLLVKRHPYSKHRFFAVVAQARWRTLIAIFFGLLLLSAAALGATFASLRGEFTLDAFLKETIQQVLILLDVGSAPQSPDSGTAGTVQNLLSGLVKLYVVFLVGLALFKFSVVFDVFRVKEKLSIVWDEQTRKGELVIRLYNSTPLEIIDIRFSAYLRRPQMDSEGRSRIVPNIELKIREKRSYWPIAIQFVPYSVQLDLQDSDIAADGKVFSSIQGKPILPSIEGGEGVSFLVLMVRGRVREFASEIVETHWYRLSGEDPQYQFGIPEPIDVIPGSEPKRAGKHPKKWVGWREFEGTRDNRHLKKN